LSASIYFNWGSSIYNIWGTFQQSDGAKGLTPYGKIGRMYYENHWQKPGDQAAYPKMVIYGNQSGLSSQESTRFMYDGSYIRLRNLKLGYDLPVVQWELPVSAIQVYVQASNLLTYIHDDLLPFDPEVSASGLLDQNIPVSKQFYFGIDIKF